MLYTKSGLALQEFVSTKCVYGWRNNNKKKVRCTLCIRVCYMQEILDELLHLNPRVYRILYNCRQHYLLKFVQGVSVCIM